MAVDFYHRRFFVIRFWECTFFISILIYLTIPKEKAEKSFSSAFSLSYFTPLFFKISSIWRTLASQEHARA